VYKEAVEGNVFYYGWLKAKKEGGVPVGRSIKTIIYDATF